MSIQVKADYIIIKKLPRHLGQKCIEGHDLKACSLNLSQRVAKPLKYFVCAVGGKVFSL